MLHALFLSSSSSSSFSLIHRTHISRSPYFSPKHTTNIDTIPTFVYFVYSVYPTMSTNSSDIPNAWDDDWEKQADVRTYMHTFMHARLSLRNGLFRFQICTNIFLRTDPSLRTTTATRTKTPSKSRQSATKSTTGRIQQTIVG